jgi:hypothetical protein
MIEFLRKHIFHQTSKHIYMHAPGQGREPGPRAPSAAPPRPGRGLQRSRRKSVRSHSTGGHDLPILSLILNYAYLWFAVLENCKLFELRRETINVPESGRRVLLVCNKSVRHKVRLSAQMAEALCMARLGPFTADRIIEDSELRGGILISDDAIRAYLPGTTLGYLHKLESAKMSSSFWATTYKNGSNCFSFVTQYSESGLQRWSTRRL